MKPDNVHEFARPDGTCHSVHALLHGCDQPVPEGHWSCDRHAVAAYKRSKQLVADTEKTKRYGRGKR